MDAALFSNQGHAVLHPRVFTYFRAVAEELNFHRAAERVHITQPALWRQIRDLERELGVELLARHPRGVSLTPAGEVFLADTIDIIARIDLAKHRALQAAKGQLGVLRIGFNEFAGRNSSLTQYFKNFRAQAPGVDLELHVMMSQRQIEALENGEIDAGFLFNRPPANPRFGSHGISRDTHVLALPRDHALVKRHKIRLSDLTGEPIILPSPTIDRAMHSLLLNACLAGGLSPRVAQHADNEHTLINMVATGMGVALVTSSCPYLHGGVVLRVLEDLVVPIHLELVWLLENESPALRAFLRLVRENPADLLEINRLVFAEIG